jgi:SAM-dependent methyltransferase
VLRNFKRRLKVRLRDAVMSLGIDLYRHSPDRKLLQKTLLPYFSGAATYPHVLFVGCDWYTHGYQRWFVRQDYWTLDFDPDKQRYGAKQHITDSLTNLSRHFAPGSLDVIFCNGVFGYGLNQRVDTDQAFHACHHSLRPGGILILGWNDVPEHCPFDPMAALHHQGFKNCILPALSSSRWRAPMRSRHVYDVLMK